MVESPPPKPAPGPADASRSARRAQLYLAALMLGSLLIKAHFAARAVGTELIWDERDFYDLGVLLADHGLDPRVYPGSYRSPGYPYFLAITVLALGKRVLWVTLTQVLVSVLGAALLYGAARPLYGAPAALVATGIFSLLPELVGLTHLLWSETVYNTCMIAALALLLSYHRTGALPRAPLAGAMWGVAILVKTAYIPSIPLLALVLAFGPGAERRPRRKLAAAALFLAAFLVVLSPWLVRNSIKYHKVWHLTSNQWVNVWSGNRDLGTPFTKRYYAIEDEAAREQLARHEALTWIREQGVWWLPRKLATNIPALFGPSNFNVRHMWLGAYGPIDVGRARLLVVLSIVTYLPVMVLAIAGLCAAPWDAFKLHAMALLLPAIAIHVVMVALTRYRAPLMPLLAVFAGWAASRPTSELGRILRRPAAVLMIVALIASALFSFDNQSFRDLWRGRSRWQTIHVPRGAAGPTAGDAPRPTGGGGHR